MTWSEYDIFVTEKVEEKLRNLIAREAKVTTQEWLYRTKNSKIFEPNSKDWMHFANFCIFDDWMWMTYRMEQWSCRDCLATINMKNQMPSMEDFLSKLPMVISNRNESKLAIWTRKALHNSGEGTVDFINEQCLTEDEKTFNVILQELIAHDVDRIRDEKNKVEQGLLTTNQSDDDLSDPDEDLDSPDEKSDEANQSCHTDCECDDGTSTDTTDSSEKHRCRKHQSRTEWPTPAEAAGDERIPDISAQNTTLPLWAEQAKSPKQDHASSIEMFIDNLCKSDDEDENETSKQVKDKSSSDESELDDSCTDVSTFDSESSAGEEKRSDVDRYDNEREEKVEPTERTSAWSRFKPTAKPFVPQMCSATMSSTQQYTVNTWSTFNDCQQNNIYVPKVEMSNSPGVSNPRFPRPFFIPRYPVRIQTHHMQTFQAQSQMHGGGFKPSPPPGFNGTKQHFQNTRPENYQVWSNPIQSTKEQIHFRPTHTPNQCNYTLPPQNSQQAQTSNQTPPKYLDQCQQTKTSLLEDPCVLSVLPETKNRPNGSNTNTVFDRFAAEVMNNHNSQASNATNNFTMQQQIQMQNQQPRSQPCPTSPGMLSAPFTQSIQRISEHHHNPVPGHADYRETQSMQQSASNLQQNYPTMQQGSSGMTQHNFPNMQQNTSVMQHNISGMPQGAMQQSFPYVQKPIPPQIHIRPAISGQGVRICRYPSRQNLPRPMYPNFGVSVVNNNMDGVNSNAGQRNHNCSSYQKSHF